MRYMLMIYADDKGWDQLTPAQQEEGLAAFHAYTEALQKADVLRATHRLRPASTATTVRMVNGKSQVLDGPFAESKEQLGGYFIIEVPDLDAALTWVSRCPAMRYGIIEVRPVWQ